MRRYSALLIAAAFLSALSIGPAWAEDITTAFTYQGKLTENGAPATGTYDFTFILYDAETGGSQVGSTVTVEDVTVDDGLFTVQLDFGDVFSGQRLWLEVAVRQGSSSGSYTTLSPRQELTASPNALWAEKVDWDGIENVPAGFADGVDDDTTYSAGTGLELSGGAFSISTSYRLPQGCSTGEVAKWDGSQWTCASDNNTISFWGLSGNSGTDPASNWLGTNDAAALEVRVGGRRAARFEPNADMNSPPNIIMGYRENIALPSVTGAVVAGGGYREDPSTLYNNKIYDDYCTIGGGAGNTVGDNDGDTTGQRYSTVAGGYNNTASGSRSTIGGGTNNTASGYASTIDGGKDNTASGSYSTTGGGGDNLASGYYSTVSGGYGNTASDFYTTVGGGYSNEASGARATVAGGSENTASGSRATVPGGGGNEASGEYSFAAGRRAKANADGCFVWGDSTYADITCDAVADRTVFRSSGGFYIYTSSDLSSGAYLAANSGTWTNMSDRNAKDEITPVDPEEVLEKLSQVPIYRWKYKAEPKGIRHMGPMAQDLYAAFGLGDNNRYISTIDADGIAMAAIKGLNSKLVSTTKMLHMENQKLKAENKELRTRLEKLEARLARLEKAMSSLQEH